LSLYFCDSSALVKRYVAETGSAWVESIADPAVGNEIFLAATSELEITSAVIRRSRSGSISATDATHCLAQFRQDIANDYQVLEITPSLLAHPVRLIETHALRASDAIQLATVLALQAQRTAASLSSPILNSADQELNLAAVAEGLAVEDPNTHP
jgi:predicted nucleic acid-binding protein